MRRRRAVAVPALSKLSIDRTVTLTTSAPAGSRHKGYEDIIVQDIAFKPEVTLYRRERWAMPDGRTVTAELPASVVGGCGPHLHRLVLTLHFQSTVKNATFGGALVRRDNQDENRATIRMRMCRRGGDEGRA